MDWLHNSSYWWSLVGSLGNILALTVFFGTLVNLFLVKHVRPWGALISFGCYLVLFYIEPPQNVQAAMVKEATEPQAALRTVLFALSFFLLIRKSLQVKP